MRKSILLVTLALSSCLYSSHRASGSPPREVVLGDTRFTVNRVIVRKSFTFGSDEYRAARNSRVMIVELESVTPTTFAPPGPKFDVSSWSAVDPSGKLVRGKVTIDPGPEFVDTIIRSPIAQTMARSNLNDKERAVPRLWVRVVIPIDDTTASVSIADSGKVIFTVTTKPEQKAAEPGATDNPDDAQRLREDH